MGILITVVIMLIFHFLMCRPKYVDSQVMLTLVRQNLTIAISNLFSPLLPDRGVDVNKRTVTSHFFSFQ